MTMSDTSSDSGYSDNSDQHDGQPDEVEPQGPPPQDPSEEESLTVRDRLATLCLDIISIFCLVIYCNGYSGNTHF